MAFSPIPLNPIYPNDKLHQLFYWFGALFLRLIYLFGATNSRIFKWTESCSQIIYFAGQVEKCKRK